MLRDKKLVTYKHLTVGQKIVGTKENTISRMFTGYVDSINPNFVTVSMFRRDGKKEKFDTSVMFEIEISEEEFNAKYRDKAKEVLTNIQNKMIYDELGTHEMWNSWLFGTPYEIAKHCVENDMRIVGHSTDIIPKTSWVTGQTLDVGVCAEFEDGTRIWCHTDSEYIKKLLKRYSDLLE